MRRRHNSGFKSSQESVFYVPDAPPTDETNISICTKYINKLYPNMLIQDVKLSIMPIGGRADKRPFKVSIIPPDSKVDETITKALASRENYWNLAEALCDFVANYAVELLLFDTVTFEIVYLSESATGKLVGFEFVHINPLTLVCSGKELLQHIPGDIAAKLNKPQYIKLAPERLLIFRLPSNIQGKVGRIIESLGRLSGPTEPEFFMKELDTGTKNIPYDAKVHIHAHNLALASTTKSIGWAARHLFQNEALEYYLIHRILLFERFKIELRDGILETLNKGVERGCKKLGFIGKVVVTGLPTLSDVETAQNHLKAGDATFKEILATFFRFPG